MTFYRKLPIIYSPSKVLGAFNANNLTTANVMKLKLVKSFLIHFSYFFYKTFGVFGDFNVIITHSNFVHE